MFKLSHFITAVSVLIILLTNQGLLYVKANFDPDVFCTFIKNGTVIKDPRACNTYITCIDQIPIYGSCGDLFYDRNTGNCVDPSTLQCLSSDACATKPNINGFVADPYSCNGYYYCNNNVGVLGYCTAGLIFNPETQNCIRNYPCEITMLPEDSCNIVPDGVFIKVPGSCTSYETCWRNNLLNGTCPDGFYFNAFAGICDFPSNVDCIGPTTPKPEIPENIECTEVGVFIADGISCNGYYYCRGNSDGNIDLLHGNCPVDRFFNPINGGSCVIRTEISCPYNRCVTLGHNFIQLANVGNDGCTGFLICQNGEEIAAASCPSGEYFDEMSQLCTTEVISYAACVQETNTTTTTVPTTTTTVPTTTTAPTTTEPAPTFPTTTTAPTTTEPIPTVPTTTTNFPENSAANVEMLEIN